MTNRYVNPSIESLGSELKKFIKDIYLFIICGQILPNSLTLIDPETGDAIFEVDEDQTDESTRLQQIKYIW